MISQRRYYLDKYFEQKTNLLKGDVLDIGGKKDNKRGSFKPNKNLKIFYLNNDANTNPDFYLDANDFHQSINKKFNYFFLAEVLEHLDKPTSSIKSSYKVLNPGGLGFISMPFMYRKHNDPKDMQRWTDTKLITVLEDNGFDILEILPMGGLFCVVHDFWMYSAISSSKSKFLNLINKILFKLFSPIIKFIDNKTKYLDKYITSGWFVIVKKKQD